MRCLICCLVSSSFLVLLKYSFFLSSPHVWLRPLPIFECLCKFPTLQVFWFFSWFRSSFSSIICRVSLLIVSMAHFSISNSIPISWLYILPTCIRISNFFFHFLQTIWCRGGWFFLWLVKFLYTPAFLKYKIEWHHRYYNSNGNGNYASVWKIPFLIFTSVKLLTPAVRSTLQFCMVFSITFISCTFLSVYYRALQDQILCFL